MASGITTFVGHAHGAAESSLKGIILQRGAAVALATAALPLLGWTQLPRLLALLGAHVAVLVAVVLLGSISCNQGVQQAVLAARKQQCGC
jgi:predicted PurR-regulated permease PerM